MNIVGQAHLKRSECGMVLLTLGCIACSKAPTQDMSSQLPAVASTNESGTVSKEALIDFDSTWLAERGAAILAMIFRSVELEATQQDDRVYVAGRRIQVAADVDARAREGEQHILAVDFRIGIDGTPIPALRAGVIGIDSTPETARATAVAEWGAQYAAPLGYAIAKWLGGVTPPQTRDSVSANYLEVNVGGETLHHGPPGFRGRPTDLESLTSQEFVQGIAARAVPLMGARNYFRSATVLLMVNEGSVISGECRVNGAVSPALLAELAKLSWPKDGATYMYKLFFAAAPSRE